MPAHERHTSYIIKYSVELLGVPYPKFQMTLNNNIRFDRMDITYTVLTRR